MVPWSAPRSSRAGAAAVGKSLNPANLRPISMSTGAATTTTILNGPDSPPVLFNPASATSIEHCEDEEDDRCRACHELALFTDWSQGDRVCTNCGVVAEGHLRDTRPEWKDFNDAEDLVKGLPSGARSGLVAVDESKYLGGLQPTNLSKQAFGGDSGGYGLARIRKQLKTTSKRLDHMMEKIHSKALKEAKLDRHIRMKRNRIQDDTYQNDEIRPEMEQLVLQEEEDAHRLQTALYAEKWSLDRALLLHGQENETRSGGEEERQDLLEQLDGSLRKASQDLYTAYSMISKAANMLQLPERVQTEASHRLVRFATRKDGIRVPGVASRLSKESNESQLEQKKAAMQLREFNARKQMAALNAALLFLTSRSLGWTRSIAEVCSAFVSQCNKGKNTNPMVKVKHVSRAIKEIQTMFPEYTKHTVTVSSEAYVSSAAVKGEAATANFAEFALRKLLLPPVAEACVRTLLIQLRDEQLSSGRYSGVKLPTLCAGIAYMVCMAGDVMQRLAQQHRESLNTKQSVAAKLPPRKKLKTENGPFKTDTTNDDGSSSSDDDEVLGYKKLQNVNGEDDVPFDVFSHAPIVEDPTEKQQYELKRMWDAWAEQMKWARSTREVEQSCGVSHTHIHEFYKTELYPRRTELLQLLAEAVSKPHIGGGDPLSLKDAPLAPILLAQVPIAGALMTPGGSR